MLTADEFERQYAELSGVTVEELRALGRVVRPCDCRWEGCEGWKSISQEAANEEFYPSEEGGDPTPN